MWKIKDLFKKAVSAKASKKIALLIAVLVAYFVADRLGLTEAQKLSVKEAITTVLEFVIEVGVMEAGI